MTSAGAGVSKTITVSQAADVFEVSATEISLGADTDATATFTVTSTHAFTLTSPDYDKVALSVESGKGEVEVTVTILVPNSSNSEVSRGNIVVTRTADNATKNVAVKQKAASTGDEPAAKTYTFTITKDDFNSTSYAANNNEKTSIATATDGSTMEVKWTSYQVMNQSSTMQWQKSKGYIYNSTDLGTIDNVVVDSSAGTFTTYKGSSAQPTTNGTGGYFQIKVGGATGKVNTITVTFTK